MVYKTCPVCEMPAREVPPDFRGNGGELGCIRCGSFRTSGDAYYWLSENKLKERQIAAISSYIRRNAGLTLTRPSLERLYLTTGPSVTEKCASLLLRLGKQNPIPGRDIADRWCMSYSCLQGLSAQALRMLSTTIIHRCRQCGSERIRKNGHANNGAQRAKCLECGRTFHLEPKGPRYSEQVKAQVLAAYQDRMSTRGIRRTFGVCYQTLMAWVGGENPGPARV